MWIGKTGKKCDFSRVFRSRPALGGKVAFSAAELFAVRQLSLSLSLSLGLLWTGSRVSLNKQFTRSRGILGRNRIFTAGFVLTGIFPGDVTRIEFSTGVSRRFFPGIYDGKLQLVFRLVINAGPGIDFMWTGIISEKARRFLIYSSRISLPVRNRPRRSSQRPRPGDSFFFLRGRRRDRFFNRPAPAPLFPGSGMQN